ncbi:MAG TPA: hypothetical protein PK359_02775 [Burkholderiaceae bacterium]|nr:hypothetical protein [Burkholderiaceae bacterium]
MNDGQATEPSATAHCPHAGAGAQAPSAGGLLERDDMLVFPLNKRAVAQYADGEDGGRELRLYYDDKEISFDEPDLFAFGERLAQSSQFSAGSTVTWGPGYEWPRVRDLLVQLIETDVLRHADESDSGLRQRPEGARPSPLPPGPAERARSWIEVEELTRELTGVPLEAGYLELVIPIFRIAHVALDGDGRQVGEANVFPKPLRLDVPTSWRTCIYSGTRYQVDRPMNVTALKSMRAHWDQMMAVVMIVRGKYLQRYPQVRDGWTVGHLERLATLVLAVPTFALMRTRHRVANGDLHPALSSLFRVTDGVRMTMHQMLFVPIGEPTLPPDSPMTAAEIHAYAERNYSFHSEHGVCAGPQSMIESFLGVLVDGRLPNDWQSVTLDDPVRDALDDLDATANYALHALRAHAVVFSLWPAMARTYESMSGIADEWAATGNPAVVALRDRLQTRLTSVRNATYLATEAWRADREAVYADMFEQSGAGLRPEPPTARLAPMLQPMADGQRDEVVDRINALLARRLDASGLEHAVARAQMSECIAEFLLRQQAVIRCACDMQSAVNAVLERPAPRRPFTSLEFNLHNRLQEPDPRRLPYLIDELDELLAARITVSAGRIDIEEPALAPH